MDYKTCRPCSDCPLLLSILKGTGSDCFEKLVHMALHDELTGLPNRYLLKERFLQLKAQADRNGVGFAFLFVDVNDFRQINNSYGHVVGDRAIREIARGLRKSLRSSDTVARVGGDEFVVLLDQIESRAEAEEVVAKLNTHGRFQLHANSTSIELSLSIGIGLYPLDACGYEKLADVANKSMYANKCNNTPKK